ncbi:Vacuolar fusion protein CCZ1 [Sugiyamaella lignohabitans]|uniref:Vacuolar fusion protein CCZ1 n=1 Tax=Sugiyamaella lignohabitans TaxID=796027 RepID=A0A167ENY0_9ASCO|nr:Vacuolar fusion protein CCZ1 [Sugiyamaella lignohabitans]ANB14299.1 Vacuolar fusion protein CCZ1 [Sugiyamaella lignohabitans]
MDGNGDGAGYTPNKNNPYLEYLCIYNPDLDTSGSQLEKQVLYYYGEPGSDCSINQQVRHIGLAQGVVALTNEFSSGRPLSTMEASNSRVVVKQVDEPNLWIVANFKFGAGTSSVDGKNIASADMLISQIFAAYRRWRLHYGKLCSGSDDYEDIVKNLKPWWDAWCHNWVALPTCITELFQADHIRYAKGRVSETTSEAVSAILERDNHPALVQMMILRSDDGIRLPISRPTVDNETIAAWETGSDAVSVRSSRSATTALIGSLNIQSPSVGSDTGSDSSSQTPSLANQSLNIPPSATGSETVSSGPPIQTARDASKGPLDSSGFVWTNHRANGPSIDSSSICDMVNWIQECLDCNDNSAFLESSGYVAHLNPVNYKLPRKSDKDNSPEILSGLSFPSGTAFVNGMASVIPAMSSAATSMSTATVSSMNQLMDLMTFKSKSKATEQTEHSTAEEASADQVSIEQVPSEQSSLIPESARQELPRRIVSEPPTHSKPRSSFSSYFGSLKKAPKKLPTLSPFDELSDSRFLIGFTGDLEDDAEYDTDEHKLALMVTSKRVFVQVNSEENSTYEPCRVVIYKRRPFVYVLLYLESKLLPEKDPLDSPDLYFGLHRKLASLSEPIYTDLSAGYPFTNDAAKFCYLAQDPIKMTIQSSLPPIPRAPSPDLEKSDWEKLTQARADLVQLHQALGQLTFEAREYEVERFMRTSRGWWLYWTRLPDGRIAMFARKVTSRVSNGPDSSGLLAALGKDARLWLEDYKYHGKV